MKILLLGEFSSLHKFLKEGLLELGGIDVKLMANGDGWKKIGGNDGLLFREVGSKRNKPYRCWIEPYRIAKEFVGYDVVQFINTQLYSRVINENLMCRIANNNHCVSLVAAGEDFRLYEAYKQNKFDYFMYDYEMDKVRSYERNSLRGVINIHNDKRIEQISDIIIPCMYEYMVGYEKKKKNPVIPLPINVRNIEYRENKVKDKIVFFHGVIREASKGTPFIRAALERLEEKYPNDIEVIIDGHLPYEQYVKVMEKANVVLDQCCCYSYGISACVAMAQGKVVMAGNREETRNALGVDSCPIVHIKPDVNQIYQQLEYLMEHRNDLKQMGDHSRRYVEEVHDHVKIAQKYVDAWRSTGKI